MQTQCTGRTNCSSPAPQRMRLGIGRPPRACSTIPGSNSAAARPGWARRKTSQAPWSVVWRSRSATSNPTGASETHGRLARLAVGPEGRLHRRPTPDHLLVRLALYQAAHQQGQAPGAGEGVDDGEVQRRLAELSLQAIAEGRGAAAAGPSGAVPRCRSRSGGLCGCPRRPNPSSTWENRARRGGRSRPGPRPGPGCAPAG